jgi:hypothetical protein
MHKTIHSIIATMIVLFSWASYACHSSTINSVSVVDNKNGTKTYTINLSIDLGAADGYGFGFALLFSGSGATPSVTNLATSNIAVANGYSNLIGHFGSTIGNTFPGSGTSDIFLTRYGNRSDVVTFETPDDFFGAGSVDYNNKTVVVTLSGCVQTITLDAGFTLYGNANSNKQCLNTYSIPNLDTNCNLLNLSDISFEEFKIFPNPAYTYLTITNANAIDTIEIYNSIGQSVLQLNNLNTTFNIDITNLSNGLYTIKLNSNDKEKISRFIKQ